MPDLNSGLVMAIIGQFQLGHKTFQFKSSWTMLLICLLFILILLGLGDWQLQRYYFKTHLIQSYQQSMKSKPLALADNSNFSDYQQVYSNGFYKNDLTLVVQKMHAERSGYEIFTPFQAVNASKLLLVNRGWIPGDFKHIPEVPPIVGNQIINGYIKNPEYQFILGPNILSANTTPRVLQKIQFKDIETLISAHFYPFTLRLLPENTTQPVRDWVITTVPPARHLAYAVQWFALALTLAIAGCCISIKRLKENG